MIASLVEVEGSFELTSCSNSIFGFLLGSTLAGAGLYYYVVDEYKVSNELLTEDVYVSGTDALGTYYGSLLNNVQALQAAVQRLEGYVKGLEEEVKTRR